MDSHPLMGQTLEGRPKREAPWAPRVLEGGLAQPPPPLGRRIPHNPRSVGVWGGPSPSRRPHLFFLEEGKALPLDPLYKESPRRRGKNQFLSRKRRASLLELCPSPPAPLSPSPCAGAPVGGLTERGTSLQATRRRSAGSPSPAHLLDRTSVV